MQIIHAGQALTDSGWQDAVQIAVGADGRIAAVTAQDRPADVRVDLALPAPVNLHCHAFQRAMAGLTEARGPDPRDSFWTWRRLMYRFLDQLDPDQVEAIAALVYLEMAEAGYAAVAEFHYLHHAVGGAAYANLAELSERIVAAAAQAGLGLTLLPVLYQVGGCDGRALAGGQRRFGTDPERFARLHAAAAGLIRGDNRIGVAPHSLRAVTPQGLAAALALAGEGPIHLHLAEQVAEVAEVQAAWGARPVEWLLARHDVDARWCLIHCTQMTPDETAALARTGAVAGLCPITESNLGDGIFDGTGFLGHGGQVGFGSDSCVHVALFEELRTLEYSQRLRDRSRAALARPGASTGRVLYDQAARGGAQAAGRQAGALAPGHWADIVGLETDNPWLVERRGDAALDTLIFGGHGTDCVREVWSAGRHIVTGGRHRQRDPILRAYRAAVARLRSDL